DPVGRPTTLTTSGGPVSIGYAGNNPATVSNPLGETQTFTYDSSGGHVIQHSDPLGSAMRFTYDANGNLVSTIYADDTSEQYNYDVRRNITTDVDRLGESISYSYNNRGQLTRKDLPGGAHVDYTYNGRGSLETAIDASGTTQFEYLDPQNPDLITKITYPN